MSYEHLLVERDAGVLVVTINRPRVLNALNIATLDELDHVFGTAGTDASIRVVILTGAGEKAFVAGGEINELAVENASGARGQARGGRWVFDRVGGLGEQV